MTAFPQHQLQKYSTSIQIARINHKKPSRHVPLFFFLPACAIHKNEFPLFSSFICHSKNFLYPSQFLSHFQFIFSFLNSSSCFFHFNLISFFFAWNETSIFKHNERSKYLLTYFVVAIITAVKNERNCVQNNNGKRQLGKMK